MQQQQTPQGQMQPPVQQPPQGMAQLAQAPQEPQAMRSGGIAHLPSYNFMPDNYAHGGIVAFANKGEVEADDSFDVADIDPSELPATGAGTLSNRSISNIKNTGTYDPFAESSFVGIPGGQSQEDYSKLYSGTAASAPTPNGIPSYLKIPTMDQQLAEDKTLRERLGIKGLLGEDRFKELGLEKGKRGERKDEAMRDFLMNLGFGAANAASAPGQVQQGLLGSLVTPFAKAGAPAGAAYIADLKEAKKYDTKIDEQMAAINDARRAEARGDITGARAEIDRRTTLVEKYDQARALALSRAQDRQANITAAAQRSQPKEMQEYGNAYLSSRQKLGDKRDVDVIRAEGYDKYQSYRPNATTGAAGIAAGSAAANTAARYNIDAMASVDKELENITSPLTQQMMNLRLTQPQKDQIYKDAIIKRANALREADKIVKPSLPELKANPKAAKVGAPRSVPALPVNLQQQGFVVDRR